MTDIDDLIARLDELASWQQAPEAHQLCMEAAAALRSQEQEIARLTEWSKSTFEAGFQGVFG